MEITINDKGPVFDLEDDNIMNQWREVAIDAKVLTGDGTVPYKGAIPPFIPLNQIICVTPDDFDFWELEDRTLASVGLHAALPNMNLVQRLVVSYLKGAPEGKIWGRRAPNLPTNEKWDPPIDGLEER
jgi:hypothetical protein